MEIQIDKPSPGRLFRNLYVKSQPIKVHSRKIIAPEIMVPRRHEDTDRSLLVGVRDAFREPGHYVVLGYAELKHEPDSIFYNIKMRIEHIEHVAKVDFDEMAAQAKAKSAPKSPEIV